MSKLYSKSSFDRFGDDLCEYVLSFLTFKDCFRLSCVSKQWKHLIFNNQKHFNIEKSIESQCMRKLETVFKNCLNIRSISIGSDISSDYKIYIFGYIIGNSNANINEIGFSFKGLTKNMIKDFFYKFGNNLKTIDFRGEEPIDKMLLKLCPNVTDLRHFSLDSIFERNEVLFKKLKLISFCYRPKDNERIKSLIESNKNSLQSIDVLTESDIHLNEINPLFNSLQKLTKLKSLSILCYYAIDGIIDSLKLLTNYCKLLNKIELNISLNDNKVILKVFQTISYFKDLKEFTLQSWVPFVGNIVITSEMLNKCQNLRHLSLDINFKIIINDIFFDSIDKHLPKLQSIKCSRHSDITELSFHSLSKLKSIQTIHFTRNKSDLKSKESVIKDLMKNCHKIRSIVVNKFSDNRIVLTDEHIFRN